MQRTSETSLEQRGRGKWTKISNTEWSISTSSPQCNNSRPFLLDLFLGPGSLIHTVEHLNSLTPEFLPTPSH